MVDYIGYGINLINFQFMSLMSYIATIEQISKTTYYTLPGSVVMSNMDASELVIYNRAWNSYLSDMFSPQHSTLYTMANDHTKYKITSGDFGKIVIFDNPANPVTELHGGLVSRYHAKTIVFQNLPKCVKIGEYFLSGQIKLESVNLSGLFMVRTIGDKFLRECPGLTSVNLSSLRRLSIIGNHFMANCTSIQSIIFPPSIEEIGESFLSVCIRLLDIDFSKFGKLKRIPAVFACACKSMSSINFAGLKSLEGIDNYAFAGCINIAEVVIRGSDMPHLKKIGNNFLFDCLRLKSVTFINIPSLDTIGSNFVTNSKLVEIIDLSGAYRITHIPDDFLDYMIEKIHTIKYILPPGVSEKRNYLRLILPVIAKRLDAKLVLEEESELPALGDLVARPRR
jgi:hypothetical protein